MMSCVIYAIHAFCALLLNEVLPLWCLTKIELGGLDFDSNHIGLFQSISGAYGVITQLIFYPMVAQWLGIKKVFVFSLLIVTPLVWNITEARYLLPVPESGNAAKAAFWIVLLVFGALMQQFLLFSFSALNLIMNNSVPFQKMGAVNGVGMSLGALFRAIAPTVGASMYAWSITHHNNYFISFRFVFIVIALFLVFNVCLCLKFMPKRVNAPFKM